MKKKIQKCSPSIYKNTEEKYKKNIKGKPIVMDPGSSLQGVASVTDGSNSSLFFYAIRHSDYAKAMMVR